MFAIADMLEAKLMPLTEHQEHNLKSIAKSLQMNRLDSCGNLLSQISFVLISLFAACIPRIAIYYA